MEYIYNFPFSIRAQDITYFSHSTDHIFVILNKVSGAISYNKISGVMTQFSLAHCEYRLLYNFLLCSHPLVLLLLLFCFM